MVMPDGHDADEFHAQVLDRYDLSLGNGLGQLARKVFRIARTALQNAASAAALLVTAEAMVATIPEPVIHAMPSDPMDFDGQDA